LGVVQWRPGAKQQKLHISQGIESLEETVLFCFVLLCFLFVLAPHVTIQLDAGAEPKAKEKHPCSGHLASIGLAK
jgi:hypothetical protein